MEYPEPIIVGIHDFVAKTLENDLYQRHIGRFQVCSVYGKFQINGDKETTRLRLNPSFLESYDLRCELNPQETIPGVGQNYKRCILRHYRNAGTSGLEKHFDITLLCNTTTEMIKNAPEEIGFEMIRRIVDHDTTNKGKFTYATIMWISEQLRQEPVAKYHVP